MANMKVSSSVLLLLVIMQSTFATYYYRRPVYIGRRHHHHHHHQQQQPLLWYNQPIRVLYTRPVNTNWLTHTRPYPATGMNIPSVVDRNTHHPTVLSTHDVWPNSDAVWPSETVEPTVTGNDLWNDLGILNPTVVTDVKGTGIITDAAFPSIPVPDATVPDIGFKTVDPENSNTVNTKPDLLPLIPETSIPENGVGTKDVLPGTPDIVDPKSVLPVVPDQGFVDIVPGNPDVVDPNTVLPIIPDQGPNGVLPIVPGSSDKIDPTIGFPDQGSNRAPQIPDPNEKNETRTCHITGCPSGHECVYADEWICPIYIPEVPCHCRLGCRLDYNFIPFGKEITIDECGNVCKCNNIYGAAECTQRMCSADAKSETKVVVNVPVKIQTGGNNTPFVQPATDNKTPFVQPATDNKTPFVQPATDNKTPFVQPATDNKTPFVQPTVDNKTPVNVQPIGNNNTPLSGQDALILDQGVTLSPNIAFPAFPELPTFPDTPSNFIGDEPPQRVNQIIPGSNPAQAQGVAKPVVISRNIIVPANNLLAERLKSTENTL